jgi:predicted naringenin-chalcone synthase
MSWELSSTGFLMTLSGYIPDLIEADFNTLLNNALESSGVKKDDINDWCIHPGGKKILTAVEKSIGISKESLASSYKVLREYGNMSSPTILFVLKEIMEKRKSAAIAGPVFGAAFGPGLTLETFILT